MTYDLIGRLPDYSELKVTIDDTSDVLESGCSSISLDTENNSQKKLLIIEEQCETPLSHIIEIVLYLLTFPIRGIFNCLFFNVEPWYMQVSPFLLYSEVELSGSQKHINISLTSSNYIKQTNTFTLPTFKISHGTIKSLSFKKCPERIHSAFKDYIKRIVSVLFVIFLILSYVLYIAFTINNRIVMYVVSFTLALITSIAIFILSIEYKRYKEIINSFS